MFKKLIGVNIFPIALILTFFPPITRSFKSHAKFCKVGNPNYHCSQSSEIETLSDIQAQIEAMIAGEKNDKISVPVEEIKPQSYNNKNGSNKLIAAGSAILGSLLFAYQQTQPVSGVALLNAMQKDSADLGVSCRHLHYFVEEMIYIFALKTFSKLYAARSQQSWIFMHLGILYYFTRLRHWHSLIFLQF